MELFSRINNGEPVVNRIRPATIMLASSVMSEYNSIKLRQLVNQWYGPGPIAKKMTIPNRDNVFLQIYALVEI